MKIRIIVLLVLIPLLGFSAENTYIHEFFKAKKLEKSDPDAAYDGFMRSHELAKSAGNSYYATSAGLAACFVQHNRELIAKSGQLALTVIDGIHPLASDMAPYEIACRAQLFGFLQSGLLAEGKPGFAWQANRATAETLRGKKVESNADGPSITLKEVIQMNPEYRSFGWRLIDKEAALLDVAGRTHEALGLLNDASSYLGDNWQQFPPDERFYVFNVLSARAMLLDFLGYEEEAIAAQRKLETACKMKLVSEKSSLILQVNLSRNRSQWDGPSEELLQHVQEIDTRLKEMGVKLGAGRPLAKMELALHNSQDARKALENESRDHTKLGHLFDALYADRDALVARTKNSGDNLEPEYVRVLNSMRAQGIKRGEPFVYREYGNYLIARNRPAEAIAMFAEALRLTRSFGWSLHEPRLLCSLFDAQFQTGETTAARATLTEIENWIQANPTAPAARRTLAQAARAKAYIQLGDPDTACNALALAKQLSKDLPDYRKRWLDSIVVDTTAQTVAAIPAVAAESPPFLKVQPLEVVSMAAPGDAARTRFLVFNPTHTLIQGEWLISGNGAVRVNQEVRFDAAKPSTTVLIPQTIAAGSSGPLVASITAAKDIAQADIQVAWKNIGQSTNSTSAWTVRWDRAAAGSVVMDASSLEGNPFRFSSLFHEILIPLGQSLGVPVRLKSPIPLRLEYYEVRSQQLLAIDANGNGDFTEAGDLYMRNLSGAAAAMIPPSATERQVTLAVHVFAAEKSASAARESSIILEVEVYRNGVWVKEAEDILK